MLLNWLRRSQDISTTVLAVLSVLAIRVCLSVCSPHPLTRYMELTLRVAPTSEGHHGCSY